MPKKTRGALSRNGRVSKLMRVACGWTQEDLANELRIEPKTFSAMERHAKGLSVPTALLRRSALTMQFSEALVDETFAYDQRIDELSLLATAGLATELRNVSDRVWTSYGRLFREASFAAGQEVTLVTERATARTVWELFLDLPAPSRRSRLEADPLFHRWAFAERLWRASLDAAADDARRALELAELSVTIAQRFNGDPAFRTRLQGLAWSAVANARRVWGELLPADRDFNRAKELWVAGAEGDRDILDAARFHSLEFSLRIAQRRFPEALACIDEAFSAAKPGADVTSLLIAKANLLLHLHRHGDAAAIYLEVSSKIGPSASPRDAWSARCNLAACLVALGRPGEARELLPELRRTALQIGNGLDLLRVRWREGEIEAGLGQRAEAVMILGEVRDAFLDRGILFDAALVSLEHAALQLEAGEIAEVKREAPELAEAFLHLGVAPELLASVALFWAAAQSERATAEQARVILAQLRQAGAAPAPLP